MLDIKHLRENYKEIEKALYKKNKDIDLSKFLVIDKQRRELIQKIETLKNRQNIVSKKVSILKKENKDVSEILIEMKNLSNEIKELDPKIKEIDEKIKNLLMRIPNKPNDSVPYGKTEKDNYEIRKFEKPRQFSFEPKPHWEIGKILNIIDQETAAKTTGSRFTFYKGIGARLERALINFMIDTHVKKGYEEILPPLIVNRKSMESTGQLPKFEEDMFKLENLDYFLIPTAEVPTINIHRDQILEGSKLPISYCSYSYCFRAEAGAAGRDTRGLIRQHQFSKVELVKFTTPEDSYKELEKLTNDAEEILKLLNIPYRIVKLCTGDLGFSSSMTYDIEVWMPSYNRYVEISSCSNCEDFQSRRANIRYKNNIKDKAIYPHILNGSGVAVGRTVAAILENYQNEDCSVNIPEKLVPYMMGAKIINV